MNSLTLRVQDQTHTSDFCDPQSQEADVSAIAGIYCHVYVHQYGTYLRDAFRAPLELFNKPTYQI
jgi:hypothetical protein